jgi:hypothetical protein
LIGADLLYADLTGANLVATKLTNADLSGAVLRKARGLWTATLNDAILDGADLSEIVGVRPKRLEVALGNRLTQLPSNLAIPAGWLAREAPSSKEAARRYYHRRKALRVIEHTLERLGAHNTGVAADG